MDRGFELMIPKPKQKEDKTEFNYGIKFSLFGREFVLQYSIKRKE